MNTMPAAADFNVSRRQLMIGAAGLTFAFLAKGAPAYAATPAATVKGKALTPWVSIAADGTIDYDREA